jgi:hypothetical protein
LQGSSRKPVVALSDSQCSGRDRGMDPSRLTSKIEVYF